MTPTEFKQLRQTHGLTQEQLAERMCSCARTIRNYENGTGSLPDRAVKMLKLVLKASGSRQKRAGCVGGSKSSGCVTGA